MQCQIVIIGTDGIEFCAIAHFNPLSDSFGSMRRFSFSPFSFDVSGAVAFFGPLPFAAYEVAPRPPILLVA